MVQMEWMRDYILAQQSLQGEAGAWDTLYRDACGLALGAARKLCHTYRLGWKEAEEIVSEAFQRSYDRLQNFQPVSKYSTWVCGFVRYVALEHWRKAVLREKREREYQSELTLRRLHITGSPEEIYLCKERNLHIWLAFYSLSYSHRLILASEVLGWVKPSVAQRIVRLRGQAFQEETQRAIAVLRRRYLALYGPAPRNVGSAG